jgi:non-specific serine/threonine protein kinase
MSFSADRLEHALDLLDKGIQITGDNAVIFAGMAFTHFQYSNMGIEQDYHIKKAKEFVEKAFALDPDLAEGHFVLGCIMTISGEAHKSIHHLQRAHAAKPDDPEIMMWLAWGYDMVGKMESAASLIDRCIKLDPINQMNYALRGIHHFMEGHFELAQDPVDNMHKIVPEGSMWRFWKSIVLLYRDLPDETYDFIDSNIKEPGLDCLDKMSLFLKYALKGNKKGMEAILKPDFIEAAQKDGQYSWHMATFYSYIDEKDRALDWLENAVARGFINYPYMTQIDPFLAKLCKEERFKKLMKRVKQEWENFEV